MVQIPMKSAAPLNRTSIQSANLMRIQSARTSGNIQNLNINVKKGAPTGGYESASHYTQVQQHRTEPAPHSAQSQAHGQEPAPHSAQSQTHRQESVPSSTQSQAHKQEPVPHGTQMPQTRPVPMLHNPVRKGQKAPLETGGRLAGLRAYLGWNVLNPICDVDVSAFLLGSDGKVPGDTWFVFYGQDKSPDNSTVFSLEEGTDRESISIDFNRLDSRVARIVFVLTINEALEKHLNFSMLKDAYIRILDQSGKELASFIMDEYYPNVTSMMIGEVYRHNGAWKFNAIGNGVARDLAGLCELYGVQVE